MWYYNKNNKFLSYLIVLVSLFIVVLITKDQILVLQEKLDLKETYTQNLAEKRIKLNELNELKNELLSSDTNTRKYNVEIKENEIIDYIYSFIEDSNNQKGIVLIKSISISEPVETEMWFKETLINLNLTVPNEKRLKDILNFIMSPESKYNFFITSFSFPYGNIEWDFGVSLPIKILHK